MPESESVVSRNCPTCNRFINSAADFVYCSRAAACPIKNAHYDFHIIQKDIIQKGWFSSEEAMLGALMAYVHNKAKRVEAFVSDLGQKIEAEVEAVVDKVEQVLHIGEPEANDPPLPASPPGVQEVAPVEEHTDGGLLHVVATPQADPLVEVETSARPIVDPEPVPVPGTAYATVVEPANILWIKPS